MVLAIVGSWFWPDAEPALDLLRGAEIAKGTKLALPLHGVLATSGKAGVHVIEVRIKDARPPPAQAMACEVLGEGDLAHGGAGQTGPAIDAPERLRIARRRPSL